MKKMMLFMSLLGTITTGMAQNVLSWTQLGITDEYQNVIQLRNGKIIASANSDVYEFSSITAPPQGLNFNSQMGTQRGFSQLLGENGAGAIYRATFDNGIFKYQNGTWSFNSLNGFGTGGQSWTKLSTGRLLLTKGGFLRNIYYSDDDGATWNGSSVGNEDWYAIEVGNSGNLFAAAPGSVQPGLIKSINSGSTWSYINSSVPLSKARWISKDTNGDLFVIADEFDIKKSSNDGSAWTQFSSIPNGEKGYNLLFTPSSIFLFSANSDFSVTKIYYTPKNNIQWQDITSSFPSGSVFKEMKYFDSKVFVCTSKGLFYSSLETNSCSITLPANLQTGLVGYWPFCGNANDESGNGNNGTVNGATLTSDRLGNSNGAMSTANNSSYVRTQRVITGAANNFTISLWAKPVENDIQKNEGITGQEGYGTMSVIHPSHGLNWGDQTSNAGVGINIGKNQIQVTEHTHLFISSPLVYSGQFVGWHNLVLVYKNHIPKLYIDGTLVKTGLQSSILNVHPSSGYCSVYPQSGFGSSFNPNGTPIGNYKGDFDDICIWNRALDSTEITQLYQTQSSNSSQGNVGINVVAPQRSLHVKDAIRLEPRNTPLENPVRGDMYYDGILNKLRVYDGTTWQNCW